MLPFTFTRPKIARPPIVWIADACRLDYDHLLTDPKVNQLDIHFLTSGRELLRYWQVRTPDVCLVNLQMPDFSGFDLVEMVQPLPEGTAVCLVADRYVLEEEVRALSLGVHSYLCKPLDIAIFFEFCLRPRVRLAAALFAGELPSVALPLVDELDDPAVCGLKNAERRLFD